MQPSGGRDRIARRSGGAARIRALLCRLSTGLLGFATLTACTSGGGSDSPLTGSQGTDGASTAPTAPPGKYRELPQPCDTVASGTLKSLLPGATDYAGTAALTYDTDRRVGCAWSSTSAGGESGSRYLTVDLERVVSYDPAVSDDSAAEQDYVAKAVAAHIPLAVLPPAASGTPSGPVAASPAAATSPAPARSSASPPGSTSLPVSRSTSVPPREAADALGSRALADLGDDAYLDDKVTTRDSGVHRDITIVFREANVLITVKLSQWSGDKSVIPASPELQRGARAAAGEIARQFD